MNAKGEANRSVRNTKKRLREGLLDLLREKPLNKITVRELADKVDINRGTFYFHYSDVYDMVREMEEQFAQDFHEALDVPEQQASEFLPICMRCIANHVDLCQLLLSENGDIAFLEKMKTLVNDKCARLWMAKTDNPDPNIMNIMNAFLIGGVVSALQAWLTSDEKLTPDELSDHLLQLIAHGITPIVAE